MLTKLIFLSQMKWPWGKGYRRPRMGLKMLKRRFCRFLLLAIITAFPLKFNGFPPFSAFAAADGSWRKKGRQGFKKGCRAAMKQVVFRPNSA
jgi:hypothetical protein